MKKLEIIKAYNWKTQQLTKYDSTQDAAKDLGLNEPEVYAALNKRQIVGDYSFYLDTLDTSGIDDRPNLTDY